MSDASADMDAIYRFQRHIYDLTRKPYLLGRDTLIRELAPPAGGSVLEIGCGTARNLLHIARSYPRVRCYGVDLSSVMLKTAQQSIERSGFTEQVKIAQADATDFDPDALFATAKFDRVVISFALSMIPAWEGVLQAAVGLLAPGGSLHIVDFGRQEGLPYVFRSLLYAWLGLFSVTPRENLGERMQACARIEGCTLSFRSLYRGYAAIGSLRAA